MSKGLSSGVLSNKQKTISHFYSATRFYFVKNNLHFFLAVLLSLVLSSNPLMG